MLAMLSGRILKLNGAMGYAMRFAATDSGGQQNVQGAQKVEKSINQVTLLGRVGVEPQMRGSEEHPVTVFSLATHTNYKYDGGEYQQKTEWHRISVFKPFLRDSIYKYLSKGQRALVQGRLMYGQITDAGGTVHTTTTIVADDVIFFNKSQNSESA